MDRGTAAFFRFRGMGMALKRYRRGGMIRHIVKDSYLYLGLKRTRMWREFYMLADMRTLGLPVPQPVAARCERFSAVAYRGSLVTRIISDTRTLAERIRQAPLSDTCWTRIGRRVADFHRRDVYLADLNANNILLDGHGAVFLVDFDKAEFRRRKPQFWKRGNLDRLLRSLRKLHGLDSNLHFTPANWRALQLGYRGPKA